jgi:hypothetical protein
MRCYKCTKEFSSGEGYVEKVSQNGAAFDRYICSSCKEEIAHPPTKDDKSSEDRVSVSIFKGIGALVISNLAASVLFIIAVLLTGEYNFLFAMGYVFIVAWIFFGLMKSVRGIWRWILMISSMLAYLYSIVFTFLYFLAPEFNMEFGEYLKFLASSPIENLPLVMIDIPLVILKDGFLLLTFLFFGIAIFWITRNWIPAAPKSSFKEV